MIESYVRQFEAAKANGASHAPEWLRSLRRGAIDRFQRVGFPTAKDEEWRFTPVGPIGRTEFTSVAPESAGLDPGTLEPLVFGHPEWPRIVFVDGRYQSSLSRLDAAGISLQPLADALQAEPGLVEEHLSRYAAPDLNPFSALNLALGQEGAVLKVKAGALISDPVQLVFLTTPAAQNVAFHPRILVLVEREARVQLVESYLTLAPGSRYWTNVVAELSIGEGAWVEHSRIQRESESAYHTGLSAVTQRRDSHYRSFSLSMGGAIARHDLQTRLAEPNVETLLYGLYLARGDQLIDNHTTIYHDQPDCRSWEVYKGILDDRAHGVFNGKILVQPEAQKTNAKQTNRALLLSDTAKVDTKPQLEIFADDVKCTHGATVGQLDQLASFYLQSRGIPKDTAHRLLVYAFAAEVVNEVVSEPVRLALDHLLNQRLGRGAEVSDRSGGQE